MGVVTINGKGRRRLVSGHPWVYADTVVRAEAEPGDVVAVEGPDGARLGWGLFSQGSRIAVRLVARRGGAPDRAFWKRRIERVVRARADLGWLDPAGACRLIAGDADGLPGLVADRYARVLVLSSGTQGADRLLELWSELAAECLPFELECVVDRSDAPVRRLESLESRIEVLAGRLPAELVVAEEGLAYEVDVIGGHKTGHYLDQRANRVRAAALARGARVLDAFCYDGLFGIRAALAGADSVLGLDQSEPALERARRNAERNGVAPRVRFERASCMHALRALSSGGERFGLVILDPPAFAKNRTEIAGAARGYVELNLRALALVEAPGHLVSASCSYNVRPEAFVELLARAAAASGREVYLEDLAGAAPDHAVLLALPESRYLKCAFLRVEDAIAAPGPRDAAVTDPAPG